MISAGISGHQQTMRDIGDGRSGPVEQMACRLTLCDVLDVAFVAKALSKAPSTRRRGVFHVGCVILLICEGGSGGCVQDSTWNRPQHNVVTSHAGESTSALVNRVPIIYISHYHIELRPPIVDNTRAKPQWLPQISLFCVAAGG